jgi:hypothetical protein
MQSLLATELSDRIEDARVGTGSSADPTAFVRDAAKILRERNRLDVCLARLGEEHPQRPELAAEVLDLVKGIRRFADLRGLMDERPALLSRLRSALRRLEEGDEQQPGLRYRLAVMERDQPWNAACRPDETLRTLADLLAKRRDLVRRIAAVDPQGDAARAELVAKALDKAGRDKLVEALTPSRSAPTQAEVPGAERAVATLDAQIAGTDPDSRLYGQLLARRQAAQDKLQATRQQAADEQAELARMIVQGPHGGSFEAIAELAETLRAAGLVAEAESIDRIRHDPATVAAVVAELVRD